MEHLICPRHCARSGAKLDKIHSPYPQGMLSAFPPHISVYGLCYVPDKNRKHLMLLIFGEGLDTLRECDEELSQAFMIGASDSLGYHGWAWTLNPDLLSFMQTQNQIVYFIRQAPVPITPENFEATVHFGTVRGSYIPALLRLLNGVFAPQIFRNTTWPESIRNHFASHLHRFLACLTGEWKDWNACFLPSPHQQ